MSAVTERPPEFDARVMQYLPGLRKLARKFTRSTEERDDLVTDTIAKALEDWQKFREDGGFWNWLYWTMRGIAGKGHKADRTRICLGAAAPFEADDPVLQARFSTAPVQDVMLDLEDAVRLAGRIRNGDMLLRVAGGETLRTIAEERGLSHQRIQQMVAAARSELEDRS